MLRLGERERELNTVKHHRDHFKKHLQDEMDKRHKAQEDIYNLETRVRKAMRKILHPEADTEDEEQDSCQEAC